MKRNLITAVLMTLVTTLLFGLLFPLLITGLAQVLFPKQANGELVTRNGKAVGSRLIGQSFSSPGYFHSRPSSAGTGYDASNSGGSNLGPTNQSLIARVQGAVSYTHLDVYKRQEQPLPAFADSKAATTAPAPAHKAGSWKRH